MTNAWEPILDGDLGARALDAVAAVAEVLAAGEPADCTLARGDAGHAVLFAYLAGAGVGRPGAAEEAARRCLERALDAVAAHPMDADLYAGFTGVAWAVQHLQGGDLDDEDPNESADEVVAAALSRFARTGAFDLISGLVGLGVYAVERLPRPAGARLLERVVELLAESAVEQPDGVAWRTAPGLLGRDMAARYPDGHLNLGVAHGVPGVIALLATACEAGVAADQAAPLLEGATRWLLAQRLPAGSVGAFPSLVAPGATPFPARLAWCYGDAGAASALLSAAGALGEPAWEREALAILTHAAQRTVERSGVRDGGLCHGAAGVAHIFHRAYQGTGAAALADAARRWYEHALDLRREGQGLAGFWSHQEQPPHQSADPSFLTGAAGIALALLGAVTPIDPAWDRVLLLSSPCD